MIDLPCNTEHNIIHPYQQLNGYRVHLLKLTFLCTCFFFFFLDAPFQLAVSIKEEVTSRAGSEQGEEEMEVDSTDEQQEEAKSHVAQAQSQVSRSNITTSSFNTLSSLSSLKPGSYTNTHVGMGTEPRY